jgi:hypothetical protein
MMYNKFGSNKSCKCEMCNKLASKNSIFCDKCRKKVIDNNLKVSGFTELDLNLITQYNTRRIRSKKK